MKEHKFIFTRKNLPLLIILFVAFICCLVAMLPQSLNFIIQKVQIVINRQLRKPEKWISILSSCARVAIYFIFMIAVINFTSFGKKVIDTVKSVFSNIWTELKNKEALFCLALITVFFVFCFYRILDSDYLYQDDVFRHVTGDRSWIGFSRYISEFLSMLLHTGRKISDIAPLAQFIAILMMTFEVGLLSYILTGKISLPIMFACSLVFINPLFAQCISYRYDAPYMVLAMFFPTIPFLFCKDENQSNLIFGAISFFFLILCNMAYQAAASIYIILAIFEVYRRFQNKPDTKKTLFFTLTTILSFALALLLFKVALMVPQDDDDSYFSAAVNISASAKNIAIYLKSVFKLFGGKWTQLFLVLLFGFSFVLLSKNSEQKKLTSILLTAAVFILSLVLSFGAYIIFDRPLFSPRAYMGFCFLTGLLAGFVFINSKKVISRSVVFCLIFGCIVFYYAYGNALRDQRIYQDFRTEILLSDLNKFADNNSKKNVTISGQIGLSKGFESAAKTFPVIKTIIGPLPAGGATWNDEILNFYNFNCDDPYYHENHGFPLLLSTNYHDIYGSRNDFYVVLK